MTGNGYLGFLFVLVALPVAAASGSLAAVGIDSHDEPSIEMAETQCKNYAMCDCAIPTTIECGNSGDYVAIQLECDRGVCRTVLP
jgi:hypothetical protein